MKIEEGLPDNPLDEPAEVRVARGARLLDYYGPQGWRTKIRRELDMTSDCNCVLGQVYDTFAKAARTLGISNKMQAQRYGFIVLINPQAPWGRQDDEATAALAPLWRAEIERDQAII